MILISKIKTNITIPPPIKRGKFEVKLFKIRSSPFCPLLILAKILSKKIFVKKYNKTTRINKKPPLIIK